MKRKLIKSLIAMAVTTLILFQGISASALEQNIEEENKVILDLQEEALDDHELKSEDRENEDEVIAIYDSYLKDGLNYNLGQEKDSDITKSQLESLTTLDLSNYPVENIDVLKYCINLTKANLSHGLINSIESLVDLRNLKELDLSYNIIWDLDSLSNLTNLEKLNLEENYIGDLSPLGNLVNLKELNISKSKYMVSGSINDEEYKITNLNSINSLKNLKTLIISDNRLSDLSFLEGATQLKSLDLSSNSISDITHLNKLINLEYLNLSSNKIFDFSELPKINYTRGLELKNQIIVLDSNEVKSVENIEVNNIFKDAYGEAIVPNLINGNGEYVKENNTIRWKTSNGLLSLNYGFEGTINILGKYYEYSGAVEQPVYYYDIVQEENNKQEISSNITNKTTTKTPSVPKTGDVGTLGMIGMSISSLVGLVLSRKRK